MRDEGAELLEGGRARRVRRAPRWIALATTGVVAAVGIARADRTEPRPAPAPTPAVVRAAAPPVAVTDLGHPVLYGGGRWELFGRGAEEVVRIELGRGRVTRTAVPRLAGGDAVSFVVTADRAVVRSPGQGPGYVVPDGQPARATPPASAPRVRATPHIGAPRGVPAPDGRATAVFDGGTAATYLLGLAPGARRRVQGPTGDGAAVWSPDSRWLFLAGSDGAVWAVDPATAAATMLGISLAPPVQLAVRPTGR